MQERSWWVNGVTSTPILKAFTKTWNELLAFSRKDGEF
jgi:hypothetical protein